MSVLKFAKTRRVSRWEWLWIASGKGLAGSQGSEPGASRLGRRLRAVWCIVHGLGRAGEEYEISADGKIYETQAAATKQGATTVARICYVGNDAETNETYNHGLALALTDANNGEIAIWCPLSHWFWTDHLCLNHHYLNKEDALRDMEGIANTDALVASNGKEETTSTLYDDQITETHNHVAAMAARNFKYASDVEAGTHPTGTSAWFLPSAGQWKKMIDSAGLPELDEGGHYKALRDMMGLHSEIYSVYWTSTEYVHNNGECSSAWYFSFNGEGSFSSDNKNRGGYLDNYVRSALAF